jgi:hypothetical protein
VSAELQIPAEIVVEAEPEPVEAERWVEAVDLVEGISFEFEMRGLEEDIFSL